MKLIRNFYLKDIREYEDDTGNNILSFFDNIKIHNIIDLVMLGNGKCNEEEASKILDNYLFFNENTLLSAVLEIKESLLGVGDNTEDELEDDDKISTNSFENLTALYTHFSMQLMSVGLTYTEFWSMNTKEMYQIFNSICLKLQNETNRELSNYHTLAALVGSAVWGKLPKEPPKVKLNNERQEDDDLKILSNRLSAFANSYNNQLEREEDTDG